MNEQEIELQIKEGSFKKIFKYLRSSCAAGGNDLINILKLILKKLAESSADENIRVDLFRFLVMQMQGFDLPTSVTDELVGLLATQVGHLNTNDLSVIARELCDKIKHAASKESITVLSGRWMEILPMILQHLVTSTELINWGDDDRVKGSVLKDVVVDTLCSFEWTPVMVVALAQMFREFQLTTEQLRKVVSKMVELLPFIETQEMAAFAYQLLLLAATPDQMQLVLSSIIKYFANKDRHYQNLVLESDTENGFELDKLRQTQGSVLLHFVLIARSNVDLMKAFVKMFRCLPSKEARSPLALGLAMALGMLNNTLFDQVKNVVVNHYACVAKRTECLWLRKLLPEEDSIDQVFLDVVLCCKFGWEDTIQGLIEFGFLLMDTYGPKNTSGRLIGANSFENNSACSLGASILLALFKNHNFTAPTILELLLRRLLMKCNAPVKHYLDLLANLISAMPQLLIRYHTTILRENINNMTCFPWTVTAHLIRGYVPLFKVSPQFRDALLIILRKAVFSGELECRKVAASSLLVLLRNLKVNSALSQHTGHDVTLSQIRVECSQSSSNSTYNHSSFEAICEEIMNMLRRCLTQQADIKRLVCGAFPEIIRNNPKLAESIFELLVYRLKSFQETDSGSNSAVLKINSCVRLQGGEPLVVDSVASLLSSSWECIRVIREQEEEVGVWEGRCKSLLLELVEQVSKTDPEEFAFGKSCDFSPQTVVGQKNILLAQQLRDIYEVLFQVALQNGNWSDNLGMACELFDHNDHLQKLMSESKSGEGKEEKSGKKEGKASRTNLKRSPGEFYSWSFISEFMEKMFCCDSSALHPILGNIRDHSKLVPYLVNVVVSRLKSTYTPLFDLIYPQKSLQKRILLCSTIQNVLMYYRNSCVCSAISAPLAEVLYSTLSAAFNQYPKHINLIVNCLSGINTENDDEGGSVDILKHVKVYMTLIQSILEMEEADRRKEIGALCGVVETFCSAAAQFSDDHHTDLLEGVYNWSKDICDKRFIDDPTVVKAVLSLCLSVGNHVPKSTTYLRALAVDVHRQMGDINESLTEDGGASRSQTKCINDATVEVCVVSILHQTQNVLQHLEWLQTSLKRFTNYDISDKEESGSHVETALCKHLARFADILSYLCSARLSVGTSATMMLRQTTALYRCFQAFARYHISLYTAHCGGVTASYTKLVRFVQKSLTPQVYELITFLQTNDQDENKSKKTSKTGGRMRDLQLLPALIFAIEQYENAAIQLAKRSKVPLFEVGQTMSTARDFRIIAQRVQQHLGDEDDHEDLAEERENDSQPSSAHQTVSPVMSQSSGNSSQSRNSDQSTQRSVASSPKAANQSRVAKRSRDQDKNESHKRRSGSSNGVDDEGPNTKRNRPRLFQTQRTSPESLRSLPVNSPPEEAAPQQAIRKKVLGMRRRPK